jgi:hypothetical protein
MLQSIFLTRAHFVFILVSLAGLGIVVGIVVLTPYQIYNVKCSLFDMPEYEKTFGFRLGAVGAEGGGRVTGVTWVQAGGAFDRAGVRAGDIPRMHHGIGEVCGELAAALLGREASLRLYRSHLSRPGESEARDVQLLVPR